MTRFPLILALFCAGCGLIAPSAPQPEARLIAAAPAKAALPANGWPIRTPIARLDIASEQERDAHPAENPRGYNATWHRDAAGNPLDARAPDYPAKFAEAYRERCLKPAAAIAVAHHCQGLDLHDVPGREYPQPVTYEGSPGGGRPPEWTTQVLRDTAQVCRDNHLWLGFTVRATLPVTLAHGVVKQVPFADPVTALCWQIQMVRIELGPDLANVFQFVYVDSNCEVWAWADGNGPHPLSASVFAAVQKHIPPYPATGQAGFLIMPEFGSLSPVAAWGDPAYLSVPRLAPKREANQPANARTLAAAKATGAFEIIWAPAVWPPWQPTAADEQRLVNERRAGHVLTVNATWPDPWNDVVDEVERRAAQGG